VWPCRFGYGEQAVRLAVCRPFAVSGSAPRQSCLQHRGPEAFLGGPSGISVIDGDGVRSFDGRRRGPSAASQDAVRRGKPSRSTEKPEEVFRKGFHACAPTPLAEHLYKYVFLLADSGMGKTAFVLNYYGRHLSSPKDGRTVVAVPLGEGRSLHKQVFAPCAGMEERLRPGRVAVRRADKGSTPTGARANISPRQGGATRWAARVHSAPPVSSALTKSFRCIASDRKFSSGPTGRPQVTSPPLWNPSSRRQPRADHDRSRMTERTTTTKTKISDKRHTPQPRWSPGPR
jgi:hypothetical protein